MLIKIYQNNNGVITPIHTLKRQGYYVTSREVNGKLSVVSFDSLNNMDWGVSSSIFGFQPSISNYCAAQVFGDFVHYFLTVDLNNGGNF